MQKKEEKIEDHEVMDPMKIAEYIQKCRHEV
jgi:hypothetical protein